MTARPIVPEAPKRPVCAVVALVLVMVVVLAAGCDDVLYSYPRDLVVIKLNHDGSTAWMKTIDTGKNYRMNDVIQTSDGGYSLGGIASTPLCNPRCKGYEAETPTIIRLSDSGEAISELGFPSEIKNGSGHMIVGLVQTPDSGFYAISDQGSLLLISPDGTLRGSRFLWTDILNKTEIQSIIRTHDGGSAISGFIIPCELESKFGIEQCRSPTDVESEAFVEKLDQNGNTTWSRSYDNRGFSMVDQMIELNDDKGYVSIMEHNSNNSLVLLDKNGDMANSSLINFDGYRYRLQRGTTGFSILIYRIMNGTYPVYFYDKNGIKTDIKMINFTYDPGMTTSDSGYFSVSTIGKTIIFAEKKNSDGVLVWDRQISSYGTEPRNIHIFNMIETSDGGYLIVLGIDKVR